MLLNHFWYGILKLWWLLNLDLNIILPWLNIIILSLIMPMWSLCISLLWRINSYLNLLSSLVLGRIRCYSIYNLTILLGNRNWRRWIGSLLVLLGNLVLWMIKILIWISSWLVYLNRWINIRSSLIYLSVLLILRRLLDSLLVSLSIYWRSLLIIIPSRGRVVCS